MKGHFEVLSKWLTAKILELAGFERVQDHWFYVNGIKSVDPIIIDLGANQGKFSMIMSKRFKANCFLVEPNIELLNAVDIETNRKFNYAITKLNGPVEFYFSTNPEASSLINGFTKQWKNERTAMVQGITWNSLLVKFGIDKNETIDLVKVDIEGAELDLFELFTHKDLSKIKQISVEYHDWLNKELHKRTVYTIKKFNSLGFMAFTDAPNHSWPVEMVFVNKHFVKFSVREKVFIYLYAVLRRFLPIGG
jgi:FkbM family methyltransferase